MKFISLDFTHEYVFELEVATKALMEESRSAGLVVSYGQALEYILAQECIRDASGKEVLARRLY